MQIHELDKYTGSIDDNAYLAIDDGTNTGKITAAKINESVTKAVDDINASLSARIDNIIAGGTAPSAAEVTDARQGANGVTYPSLGDAIRAQSKQLTYYEEYISGKKNLVDDIVLTRGYRIDDSGAIVESANYSYSTLIPVSAGARYNLVALAGDGFNPFYISGYDTGGNFVRKVDQFSEPGTNQVITRALNIIPDGVSYIRISVWYKYSLMALYTGETLQEQILRSSKLHDLIVCGYDAEPYQKAIGESMAEAGYGYVCNNSELDEGINEFIDSFMGTERTIFFFGTIRTAEGIHKHPKHNLIGYDCILKMGDSLGTDYKACISPTNGGVPFSSKQVITHNNTFIKGFTFDGNCENNKADGNYKHNSIYGGTICGEIYHETEYPYSQTQLISDIVLEDIRAINTMRGIIVGIGWKCRNLYIEKAATDHALYLAGADGAIVDNCYCTGTHKNGAIAISGQSWDVSRKVKNIHLKNITLYECNGIDGPLLDIRGQFSSWGNGLTLDDIFIDGLFINKRNNFQENPCITIGTYSSNEYGPDPYTLENYPLNIHINNLVADVKLYNVLFRINNARVKLENAFVRTTNIRYDRALFSLQSRAMLKKAFDFSGLCIVNDGATEDANPWTIFALDNYAAGYNYINGLNIDDLWIEGFTNYYLFNVVPGSYPNYLHLNNVSAERIVASPVGTINPATDRILIEANDYYDINE